MTHARAPSAWAASGAKEYSERRPRGWVIGVFGAMMAMVVAFPAGAEDLAVPAEVEAMLSGKVAGYDRKLVARAGAIVVIAIVARASEPSSARAAEQMYAAFRALSDIGGLPHEEFIVPWTDRAALSQVCSRRRVSMAFVSIGLESDIGAIVDAFKDLRVLTVAGALSYVNEGVVLGFDLVSGRPKIVINLPMAKKQGLAFLPNLLTLARIVE